MSPPDPQPQTTAIGVRTAHGRIRAEDLLGAFQPGQTHVSLTLLDPAELTQQRPSQPEILSGVNDKGKAQVIVAREPRSLPPGSQVVISKEKLEAAIASHKRISGELGLNPPPELYIENIPLPTPHTKNVPHAGVGAYAKGANEVTLNTAAMLAATPLEIDAVLAHELGHTQIHRKGIPVLAANHEDIADLNVAFSACDPKALGTFLDKARAIGERLEHIDFQTGTFSAASLRNLASAVGFTHDPTDPHRPDNERKQRIADASAGLPRPAGCKTR